MPRQLCRTPYILCFAVILVSGCAEGPLWRLGYLNPWVVKKWNEEEEFIASLSDHRRQIAEIESNLRRMGRQEADQAAVALRQIVLDDAVLIVRLDAVETLGQVPSPLAADALVGLLNDPEQDIRLAATQALGQRPAIESVGALRGILEKEDEIDVRLAAARALGNYEGDEAAVSALGLALVDPEPALQYRAMESLADVTGRNFGHDARKWRSYLEGGRPPEDSESMADALRNIF